MTHRSSNTKGYTEKAFLMFFILHGFAFVIHLISTIYAFGFIPSEEWKVYTNITVETNVLRLDAHSKLIYEKNNISFVIDTGPSENVLRQSFDKINPIRLIAYNELITTISHFVAIFLLHLAQYENVWKCIGHVFKCRNRGPDILSSAEKNPIYYPRPSEYNRRWFEYSITAGLLEVALAISVGHDNIYILFSLVVLNVVQQLCGFLIDDLKYQVDMSSHYIMNNDYDNFIWNQPARNMIFLFGAGFLILFAQIFTVLGGAINLDVGDNDWFFSLAVAYAILYSLFGIHLLIIHMFDLKGSDNNGYLKYFDGDAIFIILSCSVKILLSWMCITTIYEIFIEKGGEHYIIGDNKIENVDWANFRNIVIVISSLIFFFGTLFVGLMTDSSGCGKSCATNCCAKKYNH